MKKKVGLLMAAIMAVSMLAGCGSFKSDENALYIKKNGTIIQASVETFDQDYYDKDELKDYAQETIDSYVSEHDKGCVKLSSFTVKDQVAQMYLKFADYTTYSDFNGYELFVGTVAQAIAAGYDFDQSFVTITNGASADASASGDVSADTITASGNASSGDATSGDATATLTDSVVIMQESLNVKVQGNIKYVSATGTKVTSKNTVTVDKEETDGLTYIIFE